MSKRYAVEFKDGTVLSQALTFATRELAQQFCDQTVRWKGQLHVVETDVEVPCEPVMGVPDEVKQP